MNCPFKSPPLCIRVRVRVRVITPHCVSPSPPVFRCTAFGFLNALCKVAAVLGISIFQSFVGITKAVPILFAAGALAAGSFLATKLPETRGQVLQ